MKNESPKHYAKLDKQPVDFARDQGIGLQFCIGNIIKYIARYKDKHEDSTSCLKSILFYIEYIQKHYSEYLPAHSKCNEDSLKAFVYQDGIDEYQGAVILNITYFLHEGKQVYLTDAKKIVDDILNDYSVKKINSK